MIDDYSYPKFGVSKMKVELELKSDGKLHISSDTEMVVHYEQPSKVVVPAKHQIWCSAFDKNSNFIVVDIVLSDSQAVMVLFRGLTTGKFFTLYKENFNRNYIFQRQATLEEVIKFSGQL